MMENIANISMKNKELKRGTKMKEYLGKFPSYEELKQLDKEKEYIYKCFDICGSGYLRFTYNEDLERKISVDYMEGGYLHHLGLPIRTKTDIIENVFYNCNKRNYDKIIKFIEIVKQEIINNIKRK